MSARRKGQAAEPRKSGSKSRSRRVQKRVSGSRPERPSQVAAHCDSLDGELQVMRVRWEKMRAVVDVTHAAMEGHGPHSLASAATVLFDYVLTPMWEEISRLDEVIAQNKKERAS